MRTKVKICGITRPEDGVEAAKLGADAIGLVFYEPSPRYVSVTQAQAIISSVPPFVTIVGLFVNATQSHIQDILDHIPLDLLQFHGDESLSFCEAFARPYIKVVRMGHGMDLFCYEKEYASARGLLLDSYKEGVPGGTGETFNWQTIPRNLQKPIILAGGLHAGNVATAIAISRPYAVDVSGGVESAKGVKDWQKMSAFIEAVNKASTIVA